MPNDQLIEYNKLTPEQIALITDTVARNATPDELKLFLYRCNKMGLDPLKPGQIHFIKYGSGPGTVVIGIEGFRSIAQRTGHLSGVKTGVLKDEKGHLLYGWAEVSRSDWKDPVRAESPFNEYNTGKGSWQKMPETMIKKVAECAAYRMAFPNDLGGVYEQAEMDQADRSGYVLPEQPEPGDGFKHDGPVIRNFSGSLSRWNGKAISVMDPAILRQLVLAIESKAQKLNKPIPAWAQEFIEHATPIIGAWENLPVDEEREPGSDG